MGKFADITVALICIFFICPFTNANFTYAGIIFIIFMLYDLHQSMRFYFKLPDKWILLGLACLFGSLLLASFVNLDLDGAKRTLDFFFRTAPIWMLGYICSKYDVRRGIQVGVTGGVLLLCLSGSYITIIQHAKQMEGIFDSPNILAMFLEFFLPIVFYFGLKEENRGRKLSFLLSAVFVFACIYLTKSRGALASICLSGIISAGIALYLCKKDEPAFHVAKKTIFIFGIILMVVGSALVGTVEDKGNSASSRIGGERLQMAEASIQMLKDHPLAGVGVANWKENYYGPYLPKGIHEMDSVHPHNMFLSYLATAGAIGGIGYFGFLVCLFYGLYKTAKEKHDPLSVLVCLMPLLIFFFHGFIDCTLTHKPVARVFYLAVGIGIYYLPSAALFKRNN